MAQPQSNRRRTVPITNDNLAYDLARPSQTAERYSTAPQTKPRHQARPQSQPRPQSASRAAFRVMAVAPAAVVLFAVAVVLWIFTLQTRTEITQVQRDVYRLESELRAVDQVRDELQIQYESAFNFTQLEDYAVRTLGMQRPRDEQVYFLSHSSEDHAVAVAERAKSNGLVDRLDDFLSDFLAYFR